MAELQVLLVAIRVLAKRAGRAMRHLHDQTLQPVPRIPARRSSLGQVAHEASSLEPQQPRDTNSCDIPGVDTARSSICTWAKASTAEASSLLQRDFQQRDFQRATDRQHGGASAPFPWTGIGFDYCHATRPSLPTLPLADHRGAAHYQQLPSVAELLRYIPAPPAYLPLPCPTSPSLNHATGPTAQPWLRRSTSEASADLDVVPDLGPERDLPCRTGSCSDGYSDSCSDGSLLHGVRGAALARCICDALAPPLPPPPMWVHGAAQCSADAATLSAAPHHAFVTARHDSAPVHHGSALAHHGSAPAHHGSAPVQHGSAPGHGSALMHHGSASTHLRGAAEGAARKSCAAAARDVRRLPHRRVQMLAHAIRALRRAAHDRHLSAFARHRCERRLKVGYGSGPLCQLPLRS
ncbi:hypothetical protein JKP88DRAFT_247243 [Tribonema minus]|uniref:Uncharacterized protein n=1 Tax=Tribonema minus TaxID=303371 RepID=A0A835YQM8_9STRA|nr:hypothetical protein JKP88DRAFT_247243 [Tribonema minus]